jgi:1,4-dihydroxy-2-naphthoyl-CoA hydrolase
MRRKQGRIYTQRNATTNKMSSSSEVYEKNVFRYTLKELVPIMQTIRTTSENNLGKTLGFEKMYLSKTHLVLGMKIDSRVYQPFGRLHGGVNVAIAEEVCSFGPYAFHCIKYNSNPDQVGPVGLEINANHLKGAYKGVLLAVGQPIHTGRSTAVWNCHLYNLVNIKELEDVELSTIQDIIAGKCREAVLVSVCRCTTMIIGFGNEPKVSSRL